MPERPRLIDSGVKIATFSVGGELPATPIRSRLLRDVPASRPEVTDRIRGIVDAGLSLPPQISRDKVVELIIDNAQAGARQPLPVVERVATVLDYTPAPEVMQSVPGAEDPLISSRDAHTRGNHATLTDSVHSSGVANHNLRREVAARAVQLDIAEHLDVITQGPESLPDEGLLTPLAAETVLIQAANLTRLATTIFGPAQVRQEPIEKPRYHIIRAGMIAEPSEPAWADTAKEAQARVTPPENQNELVGDARLAYTASLGGDGYSHESPVALPIAEQEALVGSEPTA